MAYKLCISYGARVPYTLHKHAHTKDSVRVQNTVVV